MLVLDMYLELISLYIVSQLNITPSEALIPIWVRVELIR